jgi:hypothetical protein
MGTGPTTTSTTIATADIPTVRRSTGTGTAEG